jgi:multiple antibiotic resistance protein
MAITSIIAICVKFFLILTPFFILSVFVAVSNDLNAKDKNSLAYRTTFAVWVTCMILYMFGNVIFNYLGITLDAFRIGAGLVLMLNGIEMVRSNGIPSARNIGTDSDISVVPLAIPYTVGPGTIGTLLVMGAEAPTWSVRIPALIGITVAVILVGTMLRFSNKIAQILKQKGVNILSKLTGMFLVSLAAQLIFTGIKNILIVTIR